VVEVDNDKVTIEHHIKLDKKNYCKGKLPNKQSLILLMDSGASINLISRGLIERSPYLKSLPIQQAENVLNVTIACSVKTQCVDYIVFNIILQGQEFKVLAYILPYMGGVDVILGARSMSILDADLHFKKDCKENVLKWKSKSVLVHSVKDTELYPGQMKTLQIIAKVPHSLKSSELYMQTTKFMQKIAPSMCIVQMRKQKSFIWIRNLGNRKVTIRKSMPIGTILLKHFGSLCHEAPLRVESISDCAETLLADETALSPAAGKASCPASHARHSPRDASAQEQMHAISYRNAEPTGEHHPTPKPIPFCEGGKRIPKHLNREQIRLYKVKCKLYPFLDYNDKRLWTKDKTILRDQLELKDATISDQYRKKLWNLMESQIDAYSLHDEIGVVKNVSINLDLKDTTPFFVRPYSASEHEKEIIDHELKKLVLLGVLKPGMTSYCCPVFLMKKPHEKSGKYRILADLRTLNRRLNLLHCAAPLLRDALPIIGASKAALFSSLDIKSAFYSLPLNEQSQKYVNICGYPGSQTYTYRKLPQGMNVSPSEYNQVMSKIMSTIPSFGKNVLYIADDVLVFSKNETQHLGHIEEVLKAFKQFGLKVAPGKCEYFKKSIDYMGHKISSVDGYPTIKAQTSKIEAICHMKPPRNPKEAKSWVGMVSYLSIYLPRLQLLLQPIHKLARKNCNFVWTPECQQNFDEICKIVKSRHILSLPTKDGLMRLYVDSSIKGVGARLCQVQNGVERVLSFYSKKLPASAANWGISTLEYHGVWVAVHAYRFMLKGRHFEIYTDHNPLVQISKAKHEISGRRFRNTHLKLSDYSFDLIYKKGTELKVADHLSRNAILPEDSEDAIAFLAQSECNNIPSDEDSGNISEMNKAENAYPVTRSMTQAGNAPTLLPGLPARTRAKKAAPSTPAAAPTVAPGVPGTSMPTQDDHGLAPDVITDTGFVDGGTPTQMDLMDQPVIGDDSIDKLHGLIRQDKEYEEETERYGKLRPVAKEDESPIISVRKPEEEYYSKPRDLWNPNVPISQWYYQHMPKGKDLIKQLDTLKNRYIPHSELPVNKQNLARLQREDPYFTNIYGYVLQGILPNLTKKAQRKLILVSEGYVMHDNVLFNIEHQYKDPTTGEDRIRFRVCIPEKLVPVVFHHYHDTLLACHQGSEKTYLTLRQKFFIRRLYPLLCDYIKSCAVCQRLKRDAGEMRLREMRVNVNYVPFSEVSMDIKYMIPGIGGYKYILVACCNVTKYMMAAPLKSIDAINISQGLLSLITYWGAPKRIIVDYDRGITNQLTNFVYDALKINKTFISPYVHKSLQVERSIGTLSKFIVSNLSGNGRDWPNFVGPACFAYNTTNIVGLDVCPFTLVTGRDPPIIQDLHFGKIEDLRVSYRDFAKAIKDRLMSIQKFQNALKIHNQQREIELEAYEKDHITKFKVGSITYLLAPQISDLVTNSRKITASYIGPLIVDAVYGTDKVSLSDIYGRKLHGLHSFDRIKQGYIRTDSGSVSTLAELKQKLHPGDFDKIQSNTFQLFKDKSENDQLFSIQVTESKSVAFKTSLGPNEPSHICLTGSNTTTPFSEVLYKICDNAKSNSGLAIPKRISERRKRSILKRQDKMPPIGAELKPAKARFKNGMLEVLLVYNFPGKEESRYPRYTMWYNTYGNKELESYIEGILRVAGAGKAPEHTITVRGSAERFVKDLGKIPRVTLGLAKENQ